jgi:hypothetical protein
MHLVEAHGLLAMMAEQQRPPLPCQVTVGGEECWPAAAAALASLSGMLDDVSSPAELCEAVEHGCSLLRCGIIRPRDVRQEAGRVIAEVLQWGQHADNEGQSAPDAAGVPRGGRNPDATG